MFATVNPDDFKTANAAKMDENLLVRFFHKEREDKAKTLLEGRPCFKETEYVEIRVAGQRDAQACRPATFKDKQRFARHYEAFQHRVEVPEEGTLLKEWPQISRSQVEELAYLNVKTIEQLSNTSDTHIGKLHGGVALKHRAAEWLVRAGDTKLLAEKEALQIQLKEMTETMALLAEEVDNLKSDAKPKARRATKKATTTKG